MNALAIFLLTLLPILSHGEMLHGVAKDRNGNIIYIEKHSIQRDEAGLNKFIKVDYEKPDGTPFATMTSDFSNNKMIPETHFQDFRFKTKSSLRHSGHLVEFEEFKNDVFVAKKVFPLTNSMVASQGFDNFIKLNSSKLESGPVHFKFGVLGSKDFFSLIGYKRTSAAVNEVQYGIKANSWVLRLFAGELIVTYDLKSKKLKYFSGRSNILDDSGNAQNVVISYNWTGDQ